MKWNIADIYYGVKFAWRTLRPSQEVPTNSYEQSYNI